MFFDRKVPILNIYNMAGIAACFFETTCRREVHDSIFPILIEKKTIR